MLLNTTPTPETTITPTEDTGKTNTTTLTTTTQGADSQKANSTQTTTTQPKKISGIYVLIAVIVASVVIYFVAFDKKVKM